MKAVSKWKTWFPIWERNGFGANIWIPAKLINGAVVNPGETVRLLEGRRRGLEGQRLQAGRGHHQRQDRAAGGHCGGICSCSTTLFNAALRAGMKMGARRNHYYYITRYPIGLDATVFKSDGGSTQTMSFTNDTPYRCSSRASTPGAAAPATSPS